jgi:hypothetical protein
MVVRNLIDDDRAIDFGPTRPRFAAEHTAEEYLKRAGQLQVKLDSIEQTRPFVFARIVPGIGAMST